MAKHDGQEAFVVKATGGEFPPLVSVGRLVNELALDGLDYNYAIAVWDSGRVELTLTPVEEVSA